MTNREKLREYDRQRYAANPGPKLTRAKNYYKNNPDKCKARDVKRLYGLTLEEYKRLLQQPCQICGKPSRDVDHCHATNQVRGALCRSCNLGLGHFNDDPQLLQHAMNYLLFPALARYKDLG